MIQALNPDDFTLVGCDGACQVAIRKGGWAFFDGEKMESGHLPCATNNQAEYTGLIRLLERLLSKPKPTKPYLIVMDSQLVVYQVNGQYSVRNTELQVLYLRAKSLLDRLNARLEWVRREHPLMSRIDSYAKAASRP